MAAVASASVGNISSPQNSSSSALHQNDRQHQNFMPHALSFPNSLFATLPGLPSSAFLAQLLAAHQSLQPIPVPPPVVPPVNSTPQCHIKQQQQTPEQPPMPPVTPTLPSSQHHHQNLTPRSISPVPPGVYCDMGPAVFERTSRGYTVLRHEGYSFSKISDNRSKTYWRCANRTCRAKIHTNNGRIVYVGREPHVHKPRITGQNNAGGAQKVRPIKPAAVMPSPLLMMRNFGSASENPFAHFQHLQPMYDLAQNCGGGVAPLDLRPRKSESVVIFDDDDKHDAHSSSDGGAKYEESAAAKSSSSAYCAEEDDDLDIEDDEDFTPGLPKLVSNRVSSPALSSTSESVPSSPTPKKRSITTSNSNNNNNNNTSTLEANAMMTSQLVRRLPRSSSELELFRLLQRANLLGYYDAFVSRGGDDVQQLVEATEEEFAEILHLVSMNTKPLHVRRLQKTLQEWHANPASFRNPLSPAEIAALAAVKMETSPTSPPTINSQSNTSTISPRNIAAGDAALSLMLMAAKASQNGELNPLAPINLSLVSHSAYPTASSSSSSGSPSVFFSSNNVKPPAVHVIRPSDDQSSDNTSPTGGSSEFPDNTDSEASSFCHSELSSTEPSNGGLLMLNKVKATASLSPEMRQQIITFTTELINKQPELLSIPLRTDLSNSRLKSSEIQNLINVVALPRDSPAFLEGVHRFSAIYGRKRKLNDKPLTFHELCVNEASAALCILVPTLLTQRERLFNLARQIAKETFAVPAASPIPGNGHHQVSQRFATPTPPKNVEVSNKRKLEETIPSSSEKLTKLPRQEEDKSFHEESSNASTTASDRNSIAQNLAKEMGFSEVADEFQKESSGDDPQVKDQ